MSLESMIKNYLKIAYRSLLRHPGYAFINVFGFSIGLVCCLLILLYVRHELSYDRYHEKADRMYRVTIDAFVGGQEIKAPLAAAPFAESLVSNFPEVESATRIFRSSFVGMDEISVEYEENTFLESRFYYVDSTFFDVFTTSMVNGSRERLLAEPNTVVLTRSTAQKYFGAANPIGRVVRVNDQTEMRVTGVVEDVPAASHWRYDMLASLSTLPISRAPNWFSNPFTTYFTVSEGTNITDLEHKLGAFIREQIAPQMKEVLGVGIEDFLASGGRYEFSSQAVTDIHLHSNLSYELEANSDIRYVYTFSIVALLILIIAAFNFMNLATARSANRSQEVGVRKALGSNRNQLVAQFLLESILLSIASMGIALALVGALLPYFNQWLGISVSLPFNAMWFIAVLGIAVLAVGLLSGLYPAFYLTAFNASSVLKGEMKTGVRSGRLRSGLVITQFMISIVLMTTTGLIYRQMEFIQDKKLGFDREHVVLLDRGATFANQSKAFKEEIMRQPGVIAVSGLDNIPGRLFGDDAFRHIDAPASDLNVLWMMYADEDIVETLGMRMAQGEGFNLDETRDSSMLLLNQSAADLYDWSYPVGEKLASPFSEPGMPDRVYSVAGVVEDFHFQSLHQEIKPMAIEFASSLDMEYFAVRTGPGQMVSAIASIESAWNTFYPDEPFSISFLDDEVAKLYEADRQYGQLLSAFAGLAIFVACLGLFGLAAYMTEQRFKEVGIRKVVGASASSIVLLFSKDFLKRIAISFLIGIPFAMYVMDQWLGRFAYRTDITWDIFIVPGLAAVAISLGTISYHAIRAALMNPIDTLRYE